MNIEWMHSRWGLVVLFALGFCIGMQVALFLCPSLVSCRTMLVGIDLNYTEINRTLAGIG